MRPPRPIIFAISLLAIVAVASACSAASASPAPAAPSMAVDADHVLELELTADLRILRDGQQVSTLPVKQGETYTFRVTNTAGYAHDFHIGPDADLSAGGHSHAGLQPWSDGSREFQYTFEAPGPLAFGCTIPGHYAQMKGVFDIQP